MKWFPGFLIFLIVLGILSYVFVSSDHTSSNASPTPTPTTFVPTPTEEVVASPAAELTTTPSALCKSENLKGTVTTEGAAGNIYGTLLLKNVSSITCTVPGGNLITATYASTVKNIKVERVEAEGVAQADIFTLKPGESLYSQIHYPNGPQCSSGVQQTPVALSYALSTTEKAGFLPTNGQDMTITTCKDASELTALQIWNLSEKPLSH